MWQGPRIDGHDGVDTGGVLAGAHTISSLDDALIRTCPEEKGQLTSAAASARSFGLAKPVAADQREDHSFCPEGGEAADPFSHGCRR
jgi:hypothetical protein